MLVCVSGPSGCGKNTLIKNLKKNREDVEFLISYTTRDMRVGESQGNPYYFVPVEELKKLYEDGEVIEFQEVHGNYYANSVKKIDEILKKGHIAIKDLDVIGTKLIKEKYNDKFNILSIYIDVSKKELRKRLIKRGDELLSIQKRLSRFEVEDEFKSGYDFVLKNLNNKKDSTYAFNSVVKHYNQFYINKPINKLNAKKIEEYKKMIENGEKLPSVKMAVYSNNDLVAITRPELLYVAQKLNSFVNKVIIKVSKAKKAKFKI